LVGKSSIASIVIENSCDADYMVQNTSSYLFHNSANIVVLRAHQQTTIEVKLPENVKSLMFSGVVLNAVTAPKKNAAISIPVTIQ
jgi:hypothetical protein